MIKTILIHAFASIVLLFTNSNLYSQAVNSEYIKAYLQQARAMGYTDQDILNLGQPQGLNGSEFQSLNSLIQSNVSERLSVAEVSPNNREVGSLTADTIAREIWSAPESDIPIFGMSLFKNVHFEGYTSDVRMTSPSTYLVGPGDELFIDIYGASERYYEAVIYPEGYVLLENIGPIYLNGLSLEEVKKVIKSRLAKVYRGILSDPQTTYVNVALGQVRSINVSVVGEVVHPGIYQLSGLSDILLALYAAGGPTKVGSLRNIVLYRDGKKVSRFDAYDFILEGNSLTNVPLRTGDVVLVKPFANRVQISGEVIRPGIYELWEGETFHDLLKYAGGINEKAANEVIYRRWGQSQRQIGLIRSSEFSVFRVLPGDIFFIPSLLERFSNRIIVEGAVERPGEYPLSDGLKLSSLVDVAGGLKPEAYLDEVIIERTNEDLSLSILTFSLKEVLEGKSESPELQREDKIKILSKYQLQGSPYIKISGEVNKAGTFPYYENITLRQALLLGLGFRESADQTFIEISRLKEEVNLGQSREIITLSAKESWLSSDTSIHLNPYDHIIVRADPDFQQERTIIITGEVKYPGVYSASNERERISSFLSRAGGLKEQAFLNGVSLIRRTEYSVQSGLGSIRSDKRQAIQELDGSNMNEATQLFQNEIRTETEGATLIDYRNSNLAALAKQERLKEIASRNPFIRPFEIEQTELLSVDIEHILKDPGGAEDLILLDGDILNVPREINTVRIRGQVMYPSSVRYDGSKSARRYINSSGGFDSRAQRSRSYVIYTNGEVAKTRRFLIFNFYPKVHQGSEIIVPVKPPKIPFGLGDAMSIASGLATIALVISQITF